MINIPAINLHPNIEYGIFISVFILFLSISMFISVCIAKLSNRYKDSVGYGVPVLLLLLFLPYLVYGFYTCNEEMCGVGYGVLMYLLISIVSVMTISYGVSIKKPNRKITFRVLYIPIFLGILFPFGMWLPIIVLSYLGDLWIFFG